MLPERVRYYLLCGLETTPEVLARLLSPLAIPADFDRRPDPERFTVREVLSHMADWEAVFQERLRLTLGEDSARFPGADPAQIAIDHDYAHADPAECLGVYHQRRLETLALLRDLSPEQWARAGTHAEIGPLAVETQAVMIASHDGYHTQQILNWTAR